MCIYYVASAVLAFSAGQESHQSYELRRYVRPAGEKYILESEIVFKKTPNGLRYQSVTHRGTTKMRLVISFDKNNRPTTANIQLKNKSKTQTADAELKKSLVKITTPAKKTTRVELKSQPVLVTTAPDWSDIMLLMRRYDRTKGGRQEFAGLWFHPTKPGRILTFVVEKKNAASITAKDTKIPLTHFRVRLRSGNYDVWADDNGVVYKLMPSRRPQSAVVLKGFERATKTLSP